jgi:hypothetical protein
VRVARAFERLCHDWPELGAFAGADVAALSSLAPDAVRARIDAVRALADAAESPSDERLLRQASGFSSTIFAQGRWKKNPDLLSDWSALLLRQALLAERSALEAERLASMLVSIPRALAHALDQREHPDSRALILARDACLGFRTQLDALADLVPPAALQAALLAVARHQALLDAMTPGEPLGHVDNLAQLLSARGIETKIETLADLFDAELARLQHDLDELRRTSDSLSPAIGAELTRETLRDDLMREALSRELELTAALWKKSGLPSCETRFEVLPVPAGLASTIPHAAVFSPRPLLPHEPAIVVLNADSPLARAPHRRLLLAVHEGAPGHALQAARANAADRPWRAVDLCPIPGAGAGVFAGELMEGWAHFAEARFAEMFPRDLALQRTVREEQLWRAARARADLGFARGEFDADRAAQFLVEKAALSPEDARSEVDDFCLNPSYGLSYTLGRVMLERMRAAAPVADERTIYESLLDRGLTPLPFDR